MFYLNSYISKAKSILFCIVVNTIIGTGVVAATANQKNCTVAEFKMIAHSSNDPRTRESLAKDWLLKSGVNCGDEQLRIISASAASWLGTSLSHEVSIIIDSLIERKISGNPAKLMDYYMPTAANFAATVETIKNPKAPPPVVQPMSGVGLGYGSMAVNNNVNSNMIYNSSDKESEKKDDAKKILFSAEQRNAVLEYFNRTRDDASCINRDVKDSKKQKYDSGNCASGCPSSMMKNGEFCSSIRRNNKLAVGQPLAFMALAKEIPLGLREKIGPNPDGFRYLMLYEDILLVKDGDNVVVDIILDYGGLKARDLTTIPGPTNTQ